MNKIRDILGQLYRGEINDEQAEVKLILEARKENLAAFIVDAKNRGWISNFNLGLNEEGEVI